MNIGKIFYETVVNMNHFEKIKTYKSSIFIIHRTDEQTVNYSYSVTAQKNYKPNQCSLQLMKNASTNLAKNKWTPLLQQ